MAKIVSRVRQIRLEYQARLGRLVPIEEVAAATGITRSALSRIERNQTERIDFETLLRLCTFYGVGPGDILVVEENDRRDEIVPALVAS
jgi:DNA-binding Xre family transcriptional regulator